MLPSSTHVSSSSSSSSSAPSSSAAPRPAGARPLVALESRLRMPPAVAAQATKLKDNVHPAERLTVAATVDGGRDRCLEAMCDCATQMRGGAVARPGSAGSSPSPGESVPGVRAGGLVNPWGSWTSASRLHRFKHAGNTPL